MDEQSPYLPMRGHDRAFEKRRGGPLPAGAARAGPYRGLFWCGPKDGIGQFRARTAPGPYDPERVVLQVAVLMNRKPDQPAEDRPRAADQMPTLRRELRGVLLVYLAFALFSCVVAVQCVGTPH